MTAQLVPLPPADEPDADLDRARETIRRKLAAPGLTNWRRRRFEEALQQLDELQVERPPATVTPIR